MEVARSLWHNYGGYSPLHSSSAISSAFPSLTPSSTPSSSRASSSSPYDINSQYHTPSSLQRAGPRSTISKAPKFDGAVENINRLGRHVVPALVALLPSFVVSSKNKKPRKIFPTSYLDGLRGVAAFFVVVHHYTIAYTVSSAQGWGLDRGGVGSQNWFWLLPIIRVVHAGRFMVVIFFVLSGYVLSYRSLKLARQGKQLELLDSLASSVFRRWLRLHLPVIASCFMAFMLARFNAWHNMPKGWEHDPSGKTHLEHVPVPFPRQQGTFFAQLYDWFVDARGMTNPFLFGRITTSKYNIGVLWTIPIEWMGSMLTFVTVLGISQTRTWVKFSVLFVLYYQSHQNAKWEWACFFSGIFLAEISFIWARPLEPPIPSSRRPEDAEKELSNCQTPARSYHSLAYNSFFLFVFIFAIHVGAQPKDGWKETPGYQWLFAHLPGSYANNPPHRATFWPSVAAIFLILALEMAPFLQRIFTTRLAQYLGEISFSLYMTHLQIQFTLGEWLVPKCMDITGGWANGQTGFLGGIALSLLILAPLTFWVADVFSRVVDEKCVKLARWISTKAFVKQ